MDFSLISKYFVLFMMYSCAGWIVETSWVAFLSKKVVDRGFLIGPYCPIYGVGALTIIILLQYFSFNPILLFIMTLITCGILEYLTSWIMEKAFKARWWDYSDKKFNINGRVCLENLIAFGLMGILVTYFINPQFENLLSYLNQKDIDGLALVLWTIFIIDLVLSIVVIFGFRKATKKANILEKGDNTEQITKMVRQWLSEESFLHRRFINAYPKLEAIKIKMKNIKTKIENVTSDAKDKVIDKTEEIKNTIGQGTQKAKNGISIGKEHLKNSFTGSKFKEKGKDK